MCLGEAGFATFGGIDIEQAEGFGYGFGVLVQALEGITIDDAAKLQGRRAAGKEQED